MHNKPKPGGFLTAAVVAGAIALAGAAVSPQAAAQTTDKWLTIVLPAEPADLEGCEASRESQGRVVKQNIVETLIEKNAKDGSLSPRLATAWELVDPTTWRIKLREGVTFHDGAPFNAETAKKSLDRTLNKAFVCGNRTKFYSDTTLEVTAVDATTLIIKTPKPDPILPMRLAGTVIVSPNTPMDKLVRTPVGTGPYIFDSWPGGQQILLKRNEKYWGTKPPVEGVRYIWRAELSVRAAMVKIGEADIALTIAEQDAIDPKMDFSYLNSETTFLRIDSSMAPLNDKRVRLALNYALDRASIIGGVMPKAVVQATQIVIPAIPGHNHEIDKKPIPYDPAKAKTLLAEAKAAGVPVDKEITLISYPANFPNAGELMEAFLAMYQAVGLNVKILNVDPGQFRSWSSKPFPQDRPPTIMLNSHDNNIGDPAFSVFHRFACEGNGSAYCDPELDKEIARVSGLEGEARVKGWQEMFRHLHEDTVPYVFLYHMVGQTRVSPRVKFVPDSTTNIEIRIQEISFK